MAAIYYGRDTGFADSGRYRAVKPKHGYLRSNLVLQYRAHADSVCGCTAGKYNAGVKWYCAWSVYQIDVKPLKDCNDLTGYNLVGRE